MGDKRQPQDWIRLFGADDIPVLARTVSELERMEGDIERVSSKQVAEVVMHDPLMTFKGLRYIQQRRNKSRLVDVTTIPHALMMLGLNPFFEHFSGQPVLETRLAVNPAGLEGALRVISRARHAALYARDWAILRHDIEVDEVITAALLHDFAELLMWCFAPETAMRLQELVRHGHMRSEAAQRYVLGFPMITLQLELAEGWQLPGLLCTLMDERHAATPRALNVSLAVALARHSANGWDDPALPDDYEMIGRLIGCGPAGAAERVQKIAQKAAPDCELYGYPAAPAVPEPVIAAAAPEEQAD